MPPSAKELTRAAEVFAALLSGEGALVTAFIRDFGKGALEFSGVDRPAKEVLQNTNRGGCFIVGLTEKAAWTGVFFLDDNPTLAREGLTTTLQHLAKYPEVAKTRNVLAEKVWASGSRTLAAITVSFDANRSPHFLILRNRLLTWKETTWFLRNAYRKSRAAN